MNPTLRRELRVAFSRRAQPLWFRITKWLIILTLVYFFWNRAWFWWLMAALTVAAISLHLYYRHRTAKWTRPWGGWNDLETAGPSSTSTGPHP